MLVVKNYKKDSHPLNKFLNTRFGVNQSPIFPFYNRYMSLNNTIKKLHIQNNPKEKKI